MKNDHRSKFSNLSNWKGEAWKKSGLQRDSNPWPPRYRCDALTTELWSHTLGARPLNWVHIFPWVKWSFHSSSLQSKTLELSNISFPLCVKMLIKWTRKQEMLRANHMQYCLFSHYAGWQLQQVLLRLPLHRRQGRQTSSRCLLHIPTF